jgi:hypothetical protein
MNVKQIQAMAASWARSFLAAALAVYMSGNHDAKAVAMGGVAALLPVVLRFLNPKDAAFGIGSSK